MMDIKKGMNTFLNAVNATNSKRNYFELYLPMNVALLKHS